MVKRAIALPLALLALCLLAPAASASFHLVKIRELRAGSAPFVELQMYSSGQNFFGGHSLTTYTAAGAELGTFTLANVAEGGNQRTALIASGPVDGVAPDITRSISLSTPGGAVCFENIDCVAYGTFSGTLPVPAGTPVPGYPAIDDSLSLTRSIAPGCATLLEGGDDSDDSATDFAIGAPSPRNNGTVPTETACTGGGGGGADDDPPQTRITKGPKKRSEKTRAKFRFSSSEPGSSFECKFDREGYEDCRSPEKIKGIDDGRHKFRVRATDAAGNTDPTPAKRRFKVLD